MKILMDLLEVSISIVQFEYVLYIKAQNFNLHKKMQTHYYWYEVWSIKWLYQFESTKYTIDQLPVFGCCFLYFQVLACLHPTKKKSQRES